MAHFYCLLMPLHHLTHPLSMPHLDHDVPHLVAFKTVYFPPFLRLTCNFAACHINDRERIAIVRTRGMLRPKIPRMGKAKKVYLR